MPDDDTEPAAQLLPRVSPLGIVEPADNDAATPRAYPAHLRLGALLVLAIFAVVVVATSALSLGAFCLTTDAGGSLPSPTGISRQGPGAKTPRAPAR